MSGVTRARLAGAVAALLLATLVLAGTAMADSLTPPAERGGAGEEVGRAGFAYLTGIRTFGAAVLWNRIDPIFHDYYEGLPLTEQTYMLPTIRMIVMLDPELQQPYFVAAWMLAQRGEVEEGVALARLGVDNNPTAGLMRANYAQILWLVVGDVEGAAEQARAGLAEEIRWASLPEQFEGYAVFRDVLRAAGDEELAERVAAKAREIDREIAERGLDHDQLH